MFQLNFIRIFVTTNKINRQIAVGVLLIFLSTLTLNAQSFRGTIRGTVTDQNGAVVPGVELVAKNVGTGIERSTITDSEGNYTIPEVPIGNYDVTVNPKGANGLETKKAENVTVEVAGEKRVDFSLNARTLDTVVTVQLNDNRVETTSTTLGGTIQNQAIQDLPFNGRDFTKMLVTVPGATGDPSGATDSPGSFGLFSSNGNRGRSNNYLLDGTDMNDGYRNLPAINEAGVFGTPATILPLEAIQEVAVLSNFEAEYGRNSGAVLWHLVSDKANGLPGPVENPGPIFLEAALCFFRCLSSVAIFPDWQPSRHPRLRLSGCKMQVYWRAIDV